MKKSLIVFMFLLCFLFIPKVYAESNTIYTVNVNNLNFRVDAGAEFDKVIESFQFSAGDVVTYISTKLDSNNDEWYKISYEINETLYTGYVFAQYVTKTTYEITTDEEFSQYLIDEGFPESYHDDLKNLHSMHPNWIFRSLKTNLDWNDAVTNESYIGKSLIYASRDVGYRSTHSQSYNWDTDKWTPLDGSTWFAANKEVVGYYMDPRNFLNQTNIFMFEALSYDPNIQTKEVVQGLLNGTFMSGNLYDDSSKSFADTFVEAGVDSNVSPLHLASRARQEQGSAGLSKSVSGASITCYSDRWGFWFVDSSIYNFFNIGAYSGSDPACNGLVYARGVYADGSTYTSYERPWNTQYKSIHGGASQIGASYISKGQDTIYLERFNVNPAAVNPIYTHQYMTNIEAPKSESSTTFSSYAELNALNNTFIFNIPIYENMPQETNLPTLLGNPNNYLNSLTINGSSVPSFDKDTLTYNLIVSSTVASVNIAATKISDRATISGTGLIDIPEENNSIKVDVTAENGVKRTYTINIKRDSTSSVSTEELLIGLKWTNSENLLSGFELNTDVNDIISEVSRVNYLASVTIKNKNQEAKENGNLATGDIITITNEDIETTYTSVIYGDVNGDGSVSIHDLLSVQKSILGINNLDTPYKKAADTNRDGSVSIKDLLSVQKHILGDKFIIQ